MPNGLSGDRSNLLAQLGVGGFIVQLAQSDVILLTCPSCRCSLLTSVPHSGPSTTARQIHNVRSERGAGGIGVAPNVATYIEPSPNCVIGRGESAERDTESGDRSKACRQPTATLGTKTA